MEVGRRRRRRDVQVLTANRLRALCEWQTSSLSCEEVLGSGKYGTVYASRDDRASVMKESVTKGGARPGLRKQAFREHVIALLQSLMVLEGCTPHLPLHYAVSISACGPCMRGNMFMERFSGSLVDLATKCLCSDEDWICLLFQLLSTFAALASVFGISHNDSYPRNILIHQDARAQRVVYRCGGATYALRWPFFAAVTDFGIATSASLMGALHCPEVSDGLVGLELPPAFGAVPPEHHILKYKHLPTFCRDAYTVLKWARFRSKSLPEASASVKCWAKASLALLDNVRSQCDAPEGLLHFVHEIFEDDWLRACGISVRLRAPSTEPPDFAFPVTEERKQDMLRRAAIALQGLPLYETPEARSGGASEHSRQGGKGDGRNDDVHQ